MLEVERIKGPIKTYKLHRAYLPAITIKGNLFYLLNLLIKDMSEAKGYAQVTCMQ